MRRKFYGFVGEYSINSFRQILCRREKFFEFVDGNYIMDMINNGSEILLSMNDEIVLFGKKSKNVDIFKLFIDQMATKIDLINFFIKNSHHVDKRFIKYINSFYKFSEDEILELLI